MATKKCPFCAEEIQHEAIVCKHCGRDLPAPATDDRSSGAQDAVRATPHRDPQLLSVGGRNAQHKQHALTLNPFRLWADCFRWRGSFSRLQFAVAYLGAVIVVSTAAVGTGFVGGALGIQAATLDSVLNVATGLMVPVLLVLTLGAAVRRLHDLAWSGWLVLLALVPCVNLGMVLFLMVAPGRGIQVPGAGPTRTAAWPVLVFVAFLLPGLAVLLLGLLVVFTQGTAIAPFLYTLF